MANRKLGEGSLQAAWRQGHKEIAQALRAFPDSLPVIEEPGQINNPTPLEVYSERNDADSSLRAAQREMRAQMQDKDTGPEPGLEPERE